MKLIKIENSISKISKELADIQERREKILKESRDVITLSAKAIVSVHVSKRKEAESCLKKTEDLLRIIKNSNVNDIQRYLIQPEAEFVEASVFYAIAYDNPVPSNKDLDVSSFSYILGLLDVIGEIKRLIYDQIREGKEKEASILFIVMEKLYILLSPLAVYDNIVQGLRRKLDVARISIENVRSIITEETRRSQLIKSIEGLSNKLVKNV